MCPFYMLPVTLLASPFREAIEFFAPDELQDFRLADFGFPKGFSISITASLP